MRKVLYLIGGLLFVSTVCIYLLIPSEIVVSETEQIESSERIISQYLNKPDYRVRWLIKASNTSSSTEFQYEFIGATYNSSSVLISGKNFKHISQISWTPYANNMIEIRWRTSQKASLNPAKRLQQYLQARKLKSSMASILERLFRFTTNTQNIYNLNIERQIVKDTLLATTNFNSIKQPDNRQIYLHIDLVRKYLEQQNVSPVNAPMLNISMNTAGSYKTTLAIPIDRPIKGNQDILVNRMVPGNILVAEVKGGPGQIKNAFNQIQAYMDDFKLSSPAIPFESLVTDRRAEPDTSGWITKIFYPIY